MSDLLCYTKPKATGFPIFIPPRNKIPNQNQKNGSRFVCESVLVTSFESLDTLLFSAKLFYINNNDCGLGNILPPFEIRSIQYKSWARAGNTVNQWSRFDSAGISTVYIRTYRKGLLIYFALTQLLAKRHSISKVLRKHAVSHGYHIIVDKLLSGLPNIRGQTNNSIIFYLSMYL